MTLSAQAAAQILSDRELGQDFDALCDIGGRLTGTISEVRALQFLRERGRAASGVEVRSLPVRYGGWHAVRAELRLGDGSNAPCHPLVRTVATSAGGLRAEVIDLGRGTPEEFEAHRGEIAGRIVLVRHELMFAAGTIHRRLKYAAAREAGAIGFLIAGPLASAVVTGSSGRGEGEDGIPALGIGPETAARLARSPSGFPTITISIETEEGPATTETLLFDMPGQSDEWVVLSAHVDGHDLAESAMDNATGVAAALSIARAISNEVSGWKRGVRLAFFSAEEWALTGSAQYVAQLSEKERQKIALNVNLDSVGGSPRLAALTSDFPQLEPFLLSIAAANGQSLRCVRPLMMNSDHANFAKADIPAIRLVAGFDDPAAHLRLVLTAADTRDKVARSELASSAVLAAALTAAACQAPAELVKGWRVRT